MSAAQQPRIGLVTSRAAAEPCMQTGDMHGLIRTLVAVADSRASSVTASPVWVVRRPSGAGGLRLLVMRAQDTGAAGTRTRATARR